MSRARFYWIFVAILIASLPSIRAIPWAHIWGLDLQNFHAFHRCAVAADPYGVPGAQCGDPLGRGMIYPPLLYWLFVWIRPFSMQQAVWIWSLATAGMLVASALFWMGRSARWAPAALGTAALVLVQMPTVFAIERGNSDIWVVALWSLAAWSFARRRWFASGLLISVAGLSKVYPLIPGGLIVLCALIHASLQASRRPLGQASPVNGRPLAMIHAARFSAGALVGLIGGFALTLAQSIKYFFEVLPPWSKAVAVIPGMSHSIPAFFPNPLWLKYAIQSALLVIWARAAVLFLRSDPKLVFAGLLAISTYFAGVSYDYNLITVYPLILVVLSRQVMGAWSTCEPAWALLVGLVGFFGNRYLFQDPGVVLYRAQVLFQVTFLLWVAIRMKAWGHPDERTAHLGRPEPVQNPGDTAPIA